VLRLFEAARSENPDEQLWRGVRSISGAPGHVDIEFNEPRKPRLLPVGNAQVECHLYDEDALAEAEKLRAGTR
jgi:peptide/nickel transport system ATP-binding protein